MENVRRIVDAVDPHATFVLENDAHAHDLGSLRHARERRDEIAGCTGDHGVSGSRLPCCSIDSDCWTGVHDSLEIPSRLLKWCDRLRLPYEADYVLSR